jgi:hypothetical protein
VYLAGGAGLCFVLYKWLGLVVGAIPILAIGGFAGLLTFYKPNNKPFLDLIEAWFKYFTQNKLYIWKKHGEEKEEARLKPVVEQASMTGNEARFSGSKLRDLAWSLDVLDLSKSKENRGT